MKAGAQIFFRAILIGIIPIRLILESKFLSLRESFYYEVERLHENASTCKIFTSNVVQDPGPGPL